MSNNNDQQQQPLSSVPVLLWPPADAADPKLPRIDLLSYMLDPKQAVPGDDAHYFQAVEVTADRIFLGRYADLERDTQDAVRRDLQNCFAEQGCARSISVKEWAKRTTERQTPRLRLRCTKVCGFGFQVNFDMERQQYYLVRSRGKSGNFLHKCAAPVVEQQQQQQQAETMAVPPPNVMAPMAVQPPHVVTSVAPPPFVPHEALDAQAAASLAYANHGAPMDSIILPQPPPSHARTNSNTGFAVPGSIPAEIHTSLPSSSSQQGQHNQNQQETHDPPPPPADGLDDFPLMIPSPPAPVDHHGNHHQQPQPHQHEYHDPQQQHQQQYHDPQQHDPQQQQQHHLFPPAAAAAPVPVPSSNHHHVFQFQNDAQAQTAQEFHDTMDTSSVDSTDEMIARHFGMTNSGQQQQQHHQHQEAQRLSNSSVLSDEMLSRSERVTSAGGGANAASRTQVNNEAEYPTVNSMRSFLNMMTGSINSSMGMAWFGRSTSTGSVPTNSEENISGHYAGNTNRSSSRDKQPQHQHSFGGASAGGAGGGDPMDTVNSALSMMSFSGMHSNTLGTTHEETTGSHGSHSNDNANPFSADFWSPPELQP